MSRADLINELRWKKFPVLSDGFVTLVDVMGDDAAIVQAARVSYGKDSRVVQAIKENEDASLRRTKLEVDVVKEAEEKLAKEDRHLIRYMMRHRHTTPFEQAEIKLLIRIPMDCWRQFVRHRTASINEYSTRYTEAIDSMDKTPPDQWRLQSQSNKQGSSGTLTEWPAGYYLYAFDADEEKGSWDLLLAYDMPGAKEEYDRDHKCWALLKKGKRDNADYTVVYVFKDLHKSECTPGKYLQLREQESQKSSSELYKERLKFGIAKEQARKDLPLSTYTEVYWKCDLHNTLHFLGLRMDSHAQKEIRDYATIIGEQIVKPLFPVVWEAFEDYRLGGMFLSRLDIEVLQAIMSKDQEDDAMLPWLSHYSEVAPNSGIWPKEWQVERSRERDECLEKLKRLGIVL